MGSNLPKRYEVPIGKSVTIDEIPIGKDCCAFGYTRDYSLRPVSYNYSCSIRFGGITGGVTIENSKVQPEDHPIEIVDFVGREHHVRIIGGDVNKLILEYMGDRQMHDPDRPLKRK